MGELVVKQIGSKGVNFTPINFLCVCLCVCGVSIFENLSNSWIKMVLY